jgi:lysine 2,3-aminomutase
VIDSHNGEGAQGPLLFLSHPQQLLDLTPIQNLDVANLTAVSEMYPFKIPPFYASLIDWTNPTCPIRLQALPTVQELSGGQNLDPLDEGSIQATPSFLKRYPKRGVFWVSGRCAMYCRFCNRRRIVGKEWKPELSREETLAFLEQDPEITEVILSGGDPMMLPASELAYILGRLRRISRIRTIRISSRLPVVFPMGIQADHLRAIEAASPVWFVVHINHPKEITPEFLEVVRLLRQVGAILLSQTVLLRMVNDCPGILGDLFERLVHAGVKPYYLFQLDDVAGASHFKVRIQTGLSIIKQLRRQISGLCIPHYALDITGGLGKVPIENQYIQDAEENLKVQNLAGRIGVYRDNGEVSRCVSCGICGEEKQTGLGCRTTERLVF